MGGEERKIGKKSDFLGVRLRGEEERFFFSYLGRFFLLWRPDIDILSIVFLFFFLKLA